MSRGHGVSVADDSREAILVMARRSPQNESDGAMPRPGQRSSRYARAPVRAATRSPRRDPPWRPADRRAESPSSRHVAREAPEGLIHMTVKQRGIPGVIDADPMQWRSVEIWVK